MIRAFARFALLVSLSCALQGLQGCADDDGDARSGTLSGTVRDGQTGKALRGARVDFLADTGEKGSDSTDKSGHFGISVQTLSPLGRLTVSKAGYRTRTVTTFMDDGDNSQQIDLLQE